MVIYERKQLTSMKNNIDLVVMRVIQMENSFDMVQERLKQEGIICTQTDEIKKEITSLKEYQESGLWLKDFECDEKGELPLDLKRGVLSEDGLYNLLRDVEERLST